MGHGEAVIAILRRGEREQRARERRDHDDLGERLVLEASESHGTSRTVARSRIRLHRSVQVIAASEDLLDAARVHLARGVADRAETDVEPPGPR